MKVVIGSILVLLGSVGSLFADETPTPAAVVQQAWTVTYASEVRYYAWRGTRGTPSNFNGTNIPYDPAPGSGSQWYVPMAMQIEGRPANDLKVQFLVRGGWVRSEQSTAGLAGAVETFTDTVMSGTWTYLGLNGIQPFVAMNVNLPTGRSALFGTAANARMDPDLVEIGSFGEGWNIGPTVGASIPITASLIVTGSVGYTWRGPFDRERSTSQTNPTLQVLTRVDPGDVVTGTVSVGYKGGPDSWTVTGAVSQETTTTENGAALYQAGRRFLLSATVSHLWPEHWGQTTVTSSYAHSSPNKVLFAGAPALATEWFNTNSDQARVTVQHLFVIDNTFAAGPIAGYLYRSTNGYNADTLQFVPEKDRWSVGALARKAIAPSVTLNAKVEHVWTREGERIAPNGQLWSVLLNQFVPGSAVPVLNNTGWTVSGGVNAKF